MQSSETSIDFKGTMWCYIQEERTLQGMPDVKKFEDF
jgi:hypothetical protein